MQRIPEEGRKIEWLKYYEYNDEDEDNSPNDNLSQKFRHILS